MNALLNIQVRVAAEQAMAQTRALQKQMNATGSGAAGLGRNAVNLNQAFQMSNLEKFGKNLQWTGRQLEYNFTLPIALAGAASTKFALDNEAAFTTVRKAYSAFTGQTAETEAELTALRTSFELLSDRYGVQQKQVLETAAAWATAGAQGVALAKATKLSIETSLLGEEDLTKATDDLLTVQSAYKLNTDQLLTTLETLNAVQVTTAITFGGLVDAVARAGGVAQAAGIDVQHLAAMAAALVPATGSAAAAGNALRTIISRLLAPTKQAADELELLGIHVDSVAWQMLNGQERIETLAQAWNGLSDAQRSQVASIVASRWQVSKFDVLMNDMISTTGVYAQALNTSADATKNHAVYAQQLATILGSTPQAFKILITNIQNALAKAILPLLPALLQVLSLFARFFDFIARQSPEVQKLGLAFLVLLAAVGPVTRYIGSFTILFTTLGKAIGFATTMLFGMSDAEVAALSATELANVGFIHQFGIIGGLWTLIKEFFLGLITFAAMPFSFAFEAMWAGFTVGATEALSVASGVFTWLLGAPFVLIGAALSGMWGMGVKGAIAFLDYLSGPFLDGMVAVGSWIATDLPGLIVGGIAAVSQAIMVLPLMLAEGIMALPSLIAAGFSAVSEFVVTVVQSIPLAIDLALSASRELILTFSVFISQIPQMIVAGVSAAAEAITTVARSIPLAFDLAFTVTGQIVSGFIGFMAALPETMVGIWNSLMFIIDALPAIMAGAWASIVAVWEGGIAALEVLQEGWLAFTTTIGTLVAAAMADPFVLAIGGLVIAVAAAVAAVGALMYKFRDEIINGIINAFNALPNAIKNILIGIARMISTFAMSVRDALSHLNPFARHSPSLVDNVTRGMATILEEYKTLLKIPGIIRQAVAAQKAFDDAVQAGAAGIQLEEYAQQKADIVAISPNAGPAIDNLINSIYQMKDALAAVNDQLSDQQRLVDDMQRQVDQDMKPWNDAIFANEEAQKKLRLEILKMKESGQSIDAIRDKMAALAGEVETLRSEQADLRKAGAGSDILAGYDQQIQALQAQHDALEGIQDPIQALQDQLSQLQDQGEELQLTRDLQFDPQLKALDDQKQKLDDLKSAYDDINSAIGTMEGHLNDMASAAKAALAAQAAAAGSLNDQMFAAGAGANFADVGGDAIPGLGREGGLPDITDFNTELQKELDDALAGMGDMDMFEPLKKMWRDAWQWVKDNVGPYVQPVVDAVNGWLAGIGIDGGGFGNTLVQWGQAIMDSPIGAALQNIGDAFKTFGDMAATVWEQVQPIFSFIGDLIIHAGEVIGPELAKWAPMFGKFEEAILHIFNVVSWFVKAVMVILSPFFAVLVAMWKTAWPVLQAVIGPIFNSIVGIIKAALEVIRGVISFVLDVINGDWGNAWNDILTVVGGIWNAIYEVISLPVNLIIGIVQGLVEGIVGFFQWLWDVLVGHSIIPDMINGIIWWFNFLLIPIQAIWTLLWGGLQAIWDNIGQPIFNGIKWILENVVIPAFTTAKDIVKTVFTDMANGVRWVWDNIISPVFGWIKDGIHAVADVVTWLKDNIWSPVWDAISTAVGNAFSGIAGFIETGINFAIDAFNLLARAVNGISDALHLPFHIDEKGHIGNIGGNQGYSGPVKSGAYAAGGVMPFGVGFATNLPTAIVGEGRSSYDEFVIPTDPKYRKRALALYASLGTRLLDAGDILSGAADFAGGALGTGKDFVVGAANVAKDFWKTINDAISAIGKSEFEMARSVMYAIKDGVVQWGTDQLKKIPGMGTVISIGGSVLGAGQDIINGVGDVASSVGGAASSVLSHIPGSPFEFGGIIPNLGAGGIVYPRPGGTLVNIGERGRAERARIEPLPANGSDGETHNHFYGDLSFPNVTSGKDAKQFIDNLETLARH